MWMIHTFISKILSLCFPVSCFICRKEGSSICYSCLSRCKKSIDTPALYITSLYNFKDPIIKKAIHAIKYFHRQDLVAPLTDELAKELQKSCDNLYTKNCILVPIPMPRLRKYIRGYNQAELIAQELSKKCSLRYSAKILVRSTTPKRQVQARTKTERLSNQHNSFKVMTSVTGLHILLIDDVTTTGATISEARDVLLKAGAISVHAATLAH